MPKKRWSKGERRRLRRKTIVGIMKETPMRMRRAAKKPKRGLW
jgi:hypothetical protein